MRRSPPPLRPSIPLMRLVPRCSPRPHPRILALPRPEGVRSMNTPIRWNTSASRIVSALARPKWDEVRLGLTLVALGYVCLFVLVVPGLVLIRLAHQGGPPDSPFGLGADGATGLGLILASMGAF